MNNKILIAASVGLSLFAAAQSQTDTQKPKPSTTQTQSARDAASGKARVQTLGNKTAQDDWTQKSAAPTGSQTGVKPVSSSSGTKAPVRVATGDVNGDGVADAAASKNSAHASESLKATSPAKGEAPRDVATGQTSGKRQHQPVRVIKSVDKSSPNQ